jgi:hypothetical protein
LKPRWRHVLLVLTSIVLAACGIEIRAQDVALQNATATCDPATRSGRVLGDRTDPAIDFNGDIATVASSDGTTYKGDLHPLFSGGAESVEVSFSGDVTSASGKQQHISGSARCETPAAARLPVGGSADFTFGGIRNSTCPAGSIPLGFAVAYKIGGGAGGLGSLSVRGIPGLAPNLEVTTAAGRTLRLEGQVGSLFEVIDVTLDSVVAPRSGTGSLSYSTSIGGQPCRADYKASLSVKP